MTDPVRPSSVFFHPRYHCCIYYCFLINDTNKTSIYLHKTLKCCELSLFKKINLTKHTHTHTHLQKNILPNTRSAPHLSTTNASATKSSRSFSWQKWIQQTKLILLIAIAIFFVLSCFTAPVTVASSIPQFLGMSARQRAPRVQPILETVLKAKGKKAALPHHLFSSTFIYYKVIYCTNI